MFLNCRTKCNVLLFFFVLRSLPTVRVPGGTISPPVEPCTLIELGVDRGPSPRATTKQTLSRGRPSPETSRLRRCLPTANRHSTADTRAGFADSCGRVFTHDAVRYFRPRRRLFGARVLATANDIVGDDRTRLRRARYRARSAPSPNPVTEPLKRRIL